VDTEQLALREEDLETILLPRLIGEVFHVTSRTAAARIFQSQAILPNTNGALGDTFRQSAVSLARKASYVCFFDLRNKSPEAIDWGLRCLFFLGARELGDEIAFLIVAPDSYAGLIQWEAIRGSALASELHIPEVECWHAGPFPVSGFSRVLNVDILRRPVDPNGLLAALRRRADADSGV
jgi:hypothetical protein